MSEVVEKPAIVDDLTTAMPESSEPAYQAWTRARIENSLAEAKSHPENRIPLSKIWKKFGLEY